MADSAFYTWATFGARWESLLSERNLAVNLKLVVGSRIWMGWARTELKYR